jgi:cell division septum initiation protein DivIVA
MQQTRKQLEQQVEQLREKLNELAAEKKDSLATSELLALSQQLDQVLLAWTNLKTTKE